MSRSTELRLLDAVSAIGRQRDFLGFCRSALSEIRSLFPCDLCFCNTVEITSSSPDVRNTLLCIGIPEAVQNAYTEYYYAIDPARNAAGPGTPTIYENWKRRARGKEEFALDFMHRLMCTDMTAGIPLFDPSGKGAAVFGFGRSGRTQLYTRDESLLRSLQPHLANYYVMLRGLQTLPSKNFYDAELAWDTKLLSRREAEVAALLCKRLRPTEIATLLLISPRTVERHVENIYLKLNVRSRKELLTRLQGNEYGKGRS